MTARQVSREIFAAYLEETLGYLPVIRTGLERYCLDSSQTDDITQVHRLTHIIKGASSMVGLSELSHTAHEVEEMLDELAAGTRALDEETLLSVLTGIEQIEAELNLLAARHAADEADDAALESAHAAADFELAYNAAPNEAVFDAAPSFAAPAIEVAIEVEAEESVDPEMLEVFQLEADDHLQIITNALTQLEAAPEDYAALHEIRRSTHTLKGAAGVVGLRTLSHVAHRMEDALDRLFDGNLRPTADLTTLLLGATEILDHLAHGARPAMLQRRIGEISERLAVVLDALHVGARAHNAAAQTRPIEASISDEMFADAESADADYVMRDDATQTAERVAAEMAEAIAAATTENLEANSSAAIAVSQHQAKRVVRVPLERLDALVKLVGELVINRTELERHVGRLTREVGELRHSTDRLRRVSTKIETDYEANSFRSNSFGANPFGANSFSAHPFDQLAVTNPFTHRASNESAHRSDFAFVADFAARSALFAENNALQVADRHGFDELEFDRYTEFHRLTRELAETTNDATSVQSEMGDLLTDFDGALVRQRRLTNEVQESLMRVRMIPLATLRSRLERSVRLAAEAEGKAVDIHITGENIELDTTVLDQIADPLLHILRNAVSHGIERPEVRRAIGKPERGGVHLHAAYEGALVTLTIVDDGAGVDVRALLARAIEGGFIAADQAAELTERETLALMFQAGLSTARELSEISGRGVGMDVVRDAVAKLGGALDVDSVAGNGTTFRLRLPLTLSATRAVIARAGGESYALTLSVIEQITRVERAAIEEADGKDNVRFGEHLYPLVHLGAWLGARAAFVAAADKSSPVMLVRVGDRRLALVVDELVENREIVIKPLGTHLRRVRGIVGATILGDGTVIPVLNPHDLVHTDEAASIAADSGAAHPNATQALGAADNSFSVMIVDDSPSVRRVMTNFIRSNDWNSIVAKDGLDALEILHNPTINLPRVILLDVEMPRMDGYELLATLRQSPRTAAIPVVMITSRTGDKHRRKALDLGASDYLSKPYDDDHLRTIIESKARSITAA